MRNIVLSDHLDRPITHNTFAANKTIAGFFAQLTVALPADLLALIQDSVVRDVEEVFRPSNPSLAELTSIYGFHGDETIVSRDDPYVRRERAFLPIGLGVRILKHVNDTLLQEARAYFGPRGVPVARLDRIRDQQQVYSLLDGDGYTPRYLLDEARGGRVYEVFPTQEYPDGYSQPPVTQFRTFESIGHGGPSFPAVTKAAFTTSYQTLNAHVSSYVEDLHEYIRAILGVQVLRFGPKHDIKKDTMSLFQVWTVRTRTKDIHASRTITPLQGRMITARLAYLLFGGNMRNFRMRALPVFKKLVDADTNFIIMSNFGMRAAPDAYNAIRPMAKPLLELDANTRALAVHALIARHEWHERRTAVGLPSGLGDNAPFKSARELQELLQPLFADASRAMRRAFQNNFTSHQSVIQLARCVSRHVDADPPGLALGLNKQQFQTALRFIAQVGEKVAPSLVRDVVLLALLAHDFDSTGADRAIVAYTRAALRAANKRQFTLRVIRRDLVHAYDYFRHPESGAENLDANQLRVSYERWNQRINAWHNARREAQMRITDAERTTPWESALEAYETLMHVPGKKPVVVDVVPLTVGTELAQEGHDMEHCVGSYYRACLQGRSRIFSIRGRSGKKRAYATVELGYSTGQWGINQCYGPRNSITEPHVRAVARDLLRRYQTAQPLGHESLMPEPEYHPRHRLALELEPDFAF